MIIALLALAVVLLVVLEKYWAPWCLKKLGFSGCPDRELAEPGQVVTWSGTVENRSRLPILFARVWQNFPVQAKVMGDSAWLQHHYTESFQQWHIEEKMTLMPRSRLTRRVQMRFTRRGVYTIGAYRLSAGDLLGLDEESVHGPGEKIVIMPRPSEDRISIQALGGFLGDISVRRFILEDPILTMGFRDYTGREPMKAISWTRTATAGTLQVKQYDHTAEQTVTVILNVEGGTEGELESCLCLTRTVCETLERKKIPYAFRTNGNLPGPVGKVFYLASGLGMTHLNTILYALGGADHTCFHSFPHLVRQTLKHRKNNESYLIITPPMDTPARAAVEQMGNAVGSTLCVLTGKEDDHDRSVPEKSV